MARSVKDSTRDKGKNESEAKNATRAGALAGGAAGGIAGAALAGAAVGGLTGPVGLALGAAVGAVSGALGGKAIDWAAEDAHWRDDFTSRPYVGPSSLYVEYAPAYRLGYERYAQYRGRTFEEVEPEFRRDWDSNRGNSPLSWEEARHATRDAFERARESFESANPGDTEARLQLDDDVVRRAQATRYHRHSYRRNHRR